jgi:thiamine-phosphate pyrophosphorylase
MARFPPGLYALTPDEPDTAALVAQVRAVIAGGARALQYRNKVATAAKRRRQALELSAICKEAGVPLIIDDDVGLALEVGATGAHIGRDDGDLATARTRLGGDRFLGASCYDRLDIAARAIAAGADHVAFGAVFTSQTKPDAAHAPLAILTAARQEFAVPIIAIGGITLENAPLAIDAGADALAVLSALFGAEDIAARARAFAALFPRR